MSDIEEKNPASRRPTTPDTFDGDTLKAVRVSMKLTQGQLAEQMSVTQATVSDWETEKTAPSRRRLQRLARILDRKDWIVDPSDVGGHAGEPLVLPDHFKGLPRCPYPAFHDFLEGCSALLVDVDADLLGRLAAREFGFGEVPTVWTYVRLLDLHRSLKRG